MNVSFQIPNLSFKLNGFSVKNVRKFVPKAVYYVKSPVLWCYFSRYRSLLVLRLEAGGRGRSLSYLSELAHDSFSIQLCRMS